MISRALLSIPLLLLFPLSARAQEVLAPAPAEDSPPAAPSAPERPRQSGKPVALRLDGAYAPRRLFSLGVTGADMGLALGAQTSRHMAWWGTTRLSLGSTENGLGVWSSRSGAEVEAVFDPIRFGIGAGLLVMGVHRAVRDQTILSYGVEGRAFARVDCVRNDDFALFLRAGIDAGAEVNGGSAFWGPAIGAGFELGVRGKKPEEWSRPPVTSASQEESAVPVPERRRDSAAGGRP